MRFVDYGKGRVITFDPPARVMTRLVPVPQISNRCSHTFSTTSHCLRRAQNLPSLRRGKFIYKLNKRLRLNTAWLPDVVILLDISPEVAFTRIKSRGKKIDRHENLADLTQAREMYLKTLRAFQAYRTTDAAHVISVDDLSLGETLRAVTKL